MEQSSGQQADSAYYVHRLAELTDSIKNFPDSAKFYFERGALRFVTKDFERAKTDLKKAVDLAPFISAYATALGQLYFSQEIPDSAIYYFKKAVHIDSANRRARLQLSFLLLKQKRYREVLLQTDTLLQQDSLLTQAMGLQSQAYQALGDTAKALKVMEKAVRIPPAGYDALMRMGDLLLGRNNGKALVYYKKAAQKDTTAAEPYYCIGLVYEKQGQTKQAMNSYNRSIVKDVDFAPAYRHLGQLYESKGNWEKAKEIFNLAIKISPTDAEAYYHRGLANEHLNNHKAAISDYKQALIFDEKLKKAAVALDKLQSNKDK